MTSQGGYQYQRPIISQNPELNQSNGQQSERANTSVQMAAQIAKESMMPHTRTNQAAQDKKKQIQFVQYEYIKNELKEEYDKRVGFLNKRLSKKAQMDPSFLLLNDMASQPLTTNNQRSGGQNAFFQGLDLIDQPRGVPKSIHQQIQLQKKILAGPKNRLSKSKMTQGGNSLMAQDRRKYGKEYSDFDEIKQTGPQKQAEYYKFYLENAQKAINLMIDKHKSQGSLSQQRVNRTSNGARSHPHNNLQISDEHIIVDRQEERHDEELQEQQASTIENTKGEGYMKSAAGVGMGHAYGIQKANVNRSYSLHERRFNPAAEILRTQVRLEPLVQRHQKISRITVRNQQKEGVSYDSKNLKQIDQGLNGNQMYISKHQVPGKQVFSGGSISIHNQRKNKPFSANQNSSLVRGGVINETPNGMKAANSTHYTSSFNKPGSVATQNNFITKYSKQINGTILSSNDSAEQYEITSKSINAAERYGIGSTDMVGKESDPQINTIFAKAENEGKTQQEIQQNEILLQQTNALQNILNNSSDQNLHERRPVTVGNNNMKYRKLQIDQINESDSHIYGDKAPSTTGAFSQNMYQQKQQYSTIGGYIRTMNSNHVGQANQRKQILLPAQINNAKRSSVSNSGANRRGAVRGELLTNGYKSLRSQGMLLAANSKSKQAAGGTQPLHTRVIPQKDGYFSQENQTFNIQTNDQQFQQSAPLSPKKTQQNRTKLVPRGLQPTKGRQFAKIMTSSNSKDMDNYIGEAKMNKDSRESIDKNPAGLNYNSSVGAHDNAIQSEQLSNKNDKIIVQDNIKQQ